MNLMPVLAAALLATWATSTRANNVISNGGFENPQAVGNPQKLLPGDNQGGWLVGGTGADHVYLYYDPTPQLAGGSGIEGYQYAQIKNSGRDGGYLFQAINLVPGLNYELSFYVGSADPDNSSSQLDILSYYPADTLLNSYIIGNVPVPSTGGIGIKHWRHQILSFTAQAAQERLIFRNDSSGYLLLDDVNLLAAVPEPTTLVVAGLCLAVVAGRGGRWRKYR